MPRAASPEIYTRSSRLLKIIRDFAGISKPSRLRVGLDFRYKGLSVRPEGVFVSRKSESDVFRLETPTAGSGLFNVNASYTYATEHYARIFTFGGQNLNDKLYRNHVNFIKDLLPEPGRGARLLHDSLKKSGFAVGI